MVDGKNKLLCDKLEVYLKEGTEFKGGLDENAVQKIVAQGNVRVINQSIHISASRASYVLEPTPLIRLSGNPAKVLREGSIITSKRILYYKDEDRVEIDPDGKVEILTPRHE